MKWYWRALIGIAIAAPASIAFGFLQALYEVPAPKRHEWKRRDRA